MYDIDWSDFKCRCSKISAMLANSRSNPCLTEKQSERIKELENKPTLTPNMVSELAELRVKEKNSTKIILSDTCINYLMEEYAWRTEGMVRITKELEIFPIEKGRIVEPESLNLLCIVDDVLYTPNTEKERVSNDFLSGELDAWLGKSIMEALVVPDIKSIWDYPTYLCKTHEDCSLDNDWQVKGYLDITKAEKGFIADCLIDTPDHVINSLKWKLLSKMDVATEEAPEFKEKWEVLERSMHFGHINPKLRVNKKNITPMSEFEQQKVYDKVKVCREWLIKFSETRNNLM